MGDLAYAITMSAVAVSAITGVLEAGRKPIDLFGVVLVALTSALGLSIAHIFPYYLKELL